MTFLGRVNEAERQNTRDSYELGASKGGNGMGAMLWQTNLRVTNSQRS
jgi:hypothetical protein